MKTLILLISLSLTTLAADFTVSGQGIPASPASPTSDQGKSLASSVVAQLIVIANTSNTPQTITILDCQGTPFYLFKAYPIPALTTWVVNLSAGPNGGLRFGGCLQWSASATSVMGTIAGSQ